MIGGRIDSPSRPKTQAPEAPSCRIAAELNCRLQNASEPNSGDILGFSQKLRILVPVVEPKGEG
jgi:hypothetical protein